MYLGQYTYSIWSVILRRHLRYVRSTLPSDYFPTRVFLHYASPPPFTTWQVQRWIVLCKLLSIYKHEQVAAKVYRGKDT